MPTTTSRRSSANNDYQNGEGIMISMRRSGRMANALLSVALLLSCMTASGQTFTSLYSFTAGADGANPDAPLIQASDGNLYGVTSSTLAGGSTIFKIGR